MYYNEEDIGPRVRKLGACPDTGRFPAVSSVRCRPFMPNLGICASKLVTLSSDMFPQTKSCVSILPLGGTVLLGKLWRSDLGGTALANRIFSSFKKPLRNIKKTLEAGQAFSRTLSKILIWICFIPLHNYRMGSIVNTPLKKVP